MTVDRDTPKPLRAVSYGGGVQSTALLVLAAERKIDFPLFVFANVGDRAENPDPICPTPDGDCKSINACPHCGGVL